MTLPLSQTGKANVDAHYTPTALAKSIVSAAADLEPNVVADLAAGRGDLLLEAEQKWPSATFVATDIDRASISHLSTIRPSWIVGRCDLRKPRSRSACFRLRKVKNSIDLLLLNPPFTCRGGTKYPVRTQVGQLNASTAMSFLLLATHYVADSGTIVVILPLGCLTNIKDVHAWNYLSEKYDIDHLGNGARGTFPRSAASTAIVRLSPRTTVSIIRNEPVQASRWEKIIEVTVTRGSCQLHRITHNSTNPVLVHYTDIRNGIVELNGRRGIGVHKCISGPSLVVPRVGRITPEKIGILNHPEDVMLSDCVIAIKPKKSKHLYPLRDRIVDNFDQLRTSYVGTGAPFVTLDRLCATLSAMGVYVE